MKEIEAILRSITEAHRQSHTVWYVISRDQIPKLFPANKRLDPLTVAAFLISGNRLPDERTSRQQFEDWCTENGLDWAEDVPTGELVIKSRKVPNDPT